MPFSVEVGGDGKSSEGGSVGREGPPRNSIKQLLKTFQLSKLSREASSTINGGARLIFPTTLTNTSLTGKTKSMTRFLFDSLAF